MRTPHTSHRIKSNVAAISVFASAGMAAAKFVVGVAIGSLALISEALHSSVDVIATVITWLVVRVSDRPADKEHHYGHGKLESISALGVIALLYVLAGGILVESYSRLREGTPPPAISAVPFIVLLVDIAVNFWRARALHRTAGETKSQALAADALHFASDVLGSVAVIVGLALAGLGYWWGDAAAAIGVAVVRALLGRRLGRVGRLVTQRATARRCRLPRRCHCLTLSCCLLDGVATRSTLVPAEALSRSRGPDPPAKPSARRLPPMHCILGPMCWDRSRLSPVWRRRGWASATATPMAA